MTAELREWIVVRSPDLEETDDPGSYLRSVVRVFCGYSGTVLWFVGGPFEYDEACISPTLATDMTAWEAAFDTGFAVNLEWRSGDDAARHEEEGLRLARALSNELGDAFEVEVDEPDEGGVRRIKGIGPGSNQAAIAAFRARVDASDAEYASPDWSRGRDIGVAGSTPLKDV